MTELNNRCLVFCPTINFYRCFVEPIMRSHFFRDQSITVVTNEQTRHKLSFNPFQMIRVIMQLREVFQPMPKLVVTHTTLTSPLVLMVAKWLGVKHRFYHNHGSGYMLNNPFLRSIFFWIEKFNCSMATRTIFVNPTIKSLFIKRGLAKANQCFCASPGSAAGIDFNCYNDKQKISRDEARMMLNLPRQAYITLYVGRPHKRKGFQFMLNQWSKPSRMGSDDMLLIVGCRREDVEAHLGSCPDNVIACGYQNHMMPYYMACDVVCVPSEFEGTCYAFLEGAACGKPLLGCDIPGTKLILQHEQEGLLFPCRNAKAFQSAYDRLKQDASLRARLGAQARQSVKPFDRLLIQNQYEAFMTEAVV